ncbi:MAG: 30S ribosomal protein S18 [Candidatus Aminicenantes bacterium]|nr:30S ribosomal protein S18 [Candidatus Aminicenantes bacterium]
MAEDRRSDRPDKPAYKKFFPPKKKFCRFCQRNVKFIDYKNSDILKKYVPDRGRISPRRVTGTCAFHQRKLAAAVKRARHMALLPYVTE